MASTLRTDKDNTLSAFLRLDQHTLTSQHSKSCNSLLSVYVLAQQMESWREYSMIVIERRAKEGERKERNERGKRDRKGKRERQTEGSYQLFTCT